ncbi:hypothetical protein [Microvirga splendida]|uniref:Uncharacterized protein n=1 Tax=Microvirga splendida TaxID=2795727 RepID=A0ABS0XZB3_9HYPH|nr:hypothetical protein [Microvirga splendida]MBJ6125383.1 hypothetical protein [Microvirga splendida]
MRKLITRILTLLGACVPVMKWCGRTGAWIVDKSVRGALLGTATVVETTARATAATLKWSGDILGKTSSIPGKVLGGLLSGGGTNIPVPAQGADEAQHERRIRAVEGAALALRRQPLLSKPKSTLAAPFEIIGEVVHEYASADPHARLEIDLDMLPPYIRSWLVARSEKELQRLAAVGPTACGEFASGRRRIVGVEKPDAVIEAERVLAQSSAAPYLANAPEEHKDSALTSMGYTEIIADRIARSKGLVPAYVPQS